MFILRSLCWLSMLVVLLPPAADGEPAPRVSFVQAAFATRVLMQDVTGVCDRNPEACETSREALVLFSRKLETGAEIVAAGLTASQPAVAAVGSADRGTLLPSDLEPSWSLDERAPKPAE